MELFYESTIKLVVSTVTKSGVFFNGCVLEKFFPITRCFLSVGKFPDRTSAIKLFLCDVQVSVFLNWLQASGFVKFSLKKIPFPTPTQIRKLNYSKIKCMRSTKSSAGQRGSARYINSHT